MSGGGRRGWWGWRKEGCLGGAEATMREVEDLLKNMKLSEAEKRGIKVGEVRWAS